jgi:hypothetical protein
MASLGNRLTFGFYSATVAALVIHKAILILLNGPFSIVQLILAGPFLFAFDFVSLVLIRKGLSSWRRSFRVAAWIVQLFIISCSGVFVSYYFVTKAQINWRRSSEVQTHTFVSVDDKVISEWKFYGKLLAQGNSHLFAVILSYLVLGLASVLIRELVRHRQTKFDPHKSTRRRSSFNPVWLEYVLPLVLVIGALFLPQSWRKVKSTLLLDTLTAVNLKSLYVPTYDPGDDNRNLGLAYDPLADPYYVTNLDHPVDPYIAAALNGTKFNNIVHIVLESMRADSFPWKEDGALAEHLKEFLDAPESPVIAETITPFMSSLANQTLSWETMWTTVPYTLKAMLGRITPFDSAKRRLLWNAPCSKRLLYRKP